MYDKTALLDRYKDYEDRLLANRIVDAAEYCRKSFTCKYTHFLDPRQQGIADELLEKFNEVSFSFEGGIPDAERKLCIIRHEDLEEDVSTNAVDIVKFSWYADGKKLSHRDFLGSLIGSGIKREMIGDIIVEEDIAYLVCKNEVTSFILLNISKIGSVSVRSELAAADIKRTDKSKEVNSTVSSLRLDSIVSSGYGVSRSKAVEAIKSGKVKLNWEDIDTPSKEVKEGDTISLRGKGRIVLQEVFGNTKKDRIRVAIKILL